MNILPILEDFKTSKYYNSSINYEIIINSMINEMIKIGSNSPCIKSKRASAIFNHKYLKFKIEHNAPPKGFSCLENECCKGNCNKVAIHAEENVLLTIAKENWQKSDDLSCFHLKIIEKQPVISENPSCVYCSKSLLTYEINKMWLWQKNGWKCWNSYDFHKETLINLNLPCKLNM